MKSILEWIVWLLLGGCLVAGVMGIVEELMFLFEWWWFSVAIMYFLMH